MSIFSNPFDSKVRLRCACGQHESDAAHQASLSASGADSSEAQQNRVVEQAVLRAIFPKMRYVGASCKRLVHPLHLRRSLPSSH